MKEPLGEHPKYASPRQILKAAHELLSEYGRWTKGTWISFGPGETGSSGLALIESERGCKFCSEGAIYACATDRPAAERAINLVENEMRRQGMEEEAIPDLNDKARTTKQQMLDLLEDSARG